MIQDIKVVIFEFGHFATINADEVVVGGPVGEVGIVGGVSVAEVNLLQQLRFGEERKCAIEGCAGGIDSSLAETLEEFVGCEVFVGGKDDLHNRITLARLTKTF